MKGQAIQFGTEGWRAVMGDEFTVENVRSVTQAIAEHIQAQGLRGAKAKQVVVGYDRRFMSDYYARAVCEVLAGNGLRAVLTPQAVPTCAVTRAVFDQQLAMGLVVTASHNPPEYNGIKVKESFGGSGSRETVASIEARIGAADVRRMDFDEAVTVGKIVYQEIVEAYVEQIKAFVDVKAIKRAHLSVVVDSMHGVGSDLIQRLLKGGKCAVVTIRGERDPLFGGTAPEPIAKYLKPLSAAVRSRRAGIGLATDGDADRVGIIAPSGQWLNPGQILCILLEHMRNVRGESGGVVKTVSNTMMINRMTEHLNVPLDEVPVGFRFVAERMRAGDILIGGEESGGIGLRGYMPERDGIMIGLLLLEALAVSGKRLPQLLQSLQRRFGNWHYGRRDLKLKQAQVERLFDRLEKEPPTKMAGIPVKSVNRLDGVKLVGSDDSWLLFRRSGTEPIARVYAESTEPAMLEKLLDVGVKLTSKD